MTQGQLDWETASQRPPLPGLRLIQVGAFYKQDTPEGFGVRFGGIDEQTLRHYFEESAAEWTSSSADERESILDDYMEQVRQYGTLRGSRKKQMTPIICINMMWLVWAGRIPNDEFNGTHFVWVGAASYADLVEGSGMFRAAQ